MSSLHSCLLTVVCWPLFIPHCATAVVDEASLSKQLSECVPLLINQLKAATKTNPYCSSIGVTCSRIGSKESAALQLKCSNYGRDLATELSCDGANPKEVLKEFIDRFCFTDIDPTTETDLAFPKLVYTMSWKDFISAIKKVKATSKPLPDKAVLVPFLLKLVKNELLDECKTLTVTCGDGTSAVTKIQGTDCTALALFKDGGKLFSREELQPKKTNSADVAFKFKIRYPEVRMEKTTRAINDLLCFTDKVKNQPFKKMSAFERAIKAVAADYTIA